VLEETRGRIRKKTTKIKQELLRTEVMRKIEEQGLVLEMKRMAESTKTNLSQAQYLLLSTPIVSRRNSNFDIM